MSGLGQNIHLLHCASALRAVGGSGVDWGATRRLQWYWCQSLQKQPRTVEEVIIKGNETISQADEK